MFYLYFFNLFVTATCQTVVVTGDYPGNFTANGTYRGKPDFFNNDRTVNLYFELAVSRRALAAEDEDAQRRFFPGDGEKRHPDDYVKSAISAPTCTRPSMYMIYVAVRIIDDAYQGPRSRFWRRMVMSSHTLNPILSRRVLLRTTLLLFTPRNITDAPAIMYR